MWVAGGGEERYIWNWLEGKGFSRWDMGLIPHTGITDWLLDRVADVRAED